MPTGFSLVHITNFSSHLVSLNPASPRSTASLCLFFETHFKIQSTTDGLKQVPTSHFFFFDKRLHSTQHRRNHLSLQDLSTKSFIDINCRVAFCHLWCQHISFISYSGIREFIPEANMTSCGHICASNLKLQYSTWRLHETLHFLTQEAEKVEILKPVLASPCNDSFTKTGHNQQQQRALKYTPANCSQ